MSDEPLVIPISGGDVFRPDEHGPVRGGGTRFVKLVPVDETGQTKLPCIWRSREIFPGIDAKGGEIRVHHCLLLACREPPTVLPADIDVRAWPSFSEGPVEW